MTTYIFYNNRKNTLKLSKGINIIDAAHAIGYEPGGSWSGQKYCYIGEL